MVETVAEFFRKHYIEKIARESFESSAIQQLFRNKDMTDIYTNVYKFNTRKQPNQQSMQQLTSNQQSMQQLTSNQQQITVEFQKFGAAFSFEDGGLYKTLDFIKRSISDNYYQEIVEEVDSMKIEHYGQRSMVDSVYSMLDKFGIETNRQPDTIILPEIDVRGTEYELDHEALDDDLPSEWSVFVDETGTVANPIVADSSTFGYDSIRTRFDMATYSDRLEGPMIYQFFTRRAPAITNADAGMKVELHG